jgi:hypothetical protein
MTISKEQEEKTVHQFSVFSGKTKKECEIFFKDLSIFILFNFKNCDSSYIPYIGKFTIDYNNLAFLLETDDKAIDYIKMIKYNNYDGLAKLENTYYSKIENSLYNLL